VNVERRVATMDKREWAGWLLLCAFFWVVIEVAFLVTGVSGMLPLVWAIFLPPIIAFAVMLLLIAYKHL